MNVLEQRISKLAPQVDRMTHPCDRREGNLQISDARTRLDALSKQYGKLP